MTVEPFALVSSRNALPPASTIGKDGPKTKAALAKVLAKAMHTDNRPLLSKVAERTSKGEWKFKEDPPVLTPISSSDEKIIEALNQYAKTLARLKRRDAGLEGRPLAGRAGGNGEGHFAELRVGIVRMMVLVR